MITLLALTLLLLVALLAGYRFLMHGLFIGAFFGIGPLLLLLNAGRLDVQALTWAKVFTLTGSILVIFFLPRVGARARIILARVLTGILVLNILEAVVADAVSGWWMNMLVGASLIASVAGPGKIATSTVAARPCVIYDLPWSWVLAYTFWNFTVVCGHYPLHYLDHCAVLSAPLIAALVAGDRRLWLEARGFTLSVYAVGIVLVLDLFGLPWIPSAPGPAVVYQYLSAIAAVLAAWNLVVRFRPAAPAGLAAKAG